MRAWSTAISLFALLALPALPLAQDAPASSADDLSGTWVLTRELTAVSQVAMVGRIRSETELVAIYTLTESGGRLQGPGTVCSMDVDTGTALARTIIPDAYITHYPLPDFDAEITRAGDTVQLSHARVPTILGADLADPYHDPIPTELDDPTVADTDHDGHPGVSLEVTGTFNGFMRTAQRTWFAFEGMLDSQGRLAGTVTWSQERVVLDATRRSLRRETETAPDDDPTRNTFVMVRVADGTTCGDL